MKIVTYISAEHGAVARILSDGGFLPVIVSAATEDDARSKAQTFWETERERLQKGGKPRGKLDPAPVLPETVGRCEPRYPETAQNFQGVDPSPQIDPMEDVLG